MIARLPGVWLGYDDSGRGTPLLLLHGFPHDRSIWAPVRSALAGRARCIAPDLRGFGESTTHGPFSMDQYADDLVALLDRLQLPTVTVAVPVVLEVVEDEGAGLGAAPAGAGFALAATA